MKKSAASKASKKMDWAAEVRKYKPQMNQLTDMKAASAKSASHFLKERAPKAKAVVAAHKNGHHGSNNGTAKTQRRSRWQDFSEEERQSLLEEAYFQMTRRPARPSIADIRASRTKTKSRKTSTIDPAELRRCRSKMNNLTALQRQRLHAQALAHIYGQNLAPRRS